MSCAGWVDSLELSLEQAESIDGKLEINMMPQSLDARWLGFPKVLVGLDLIGEPHIKMCCFSFVLSPATYSEQNGHEYPLGTKTE